VTSSGRIADLIVWTAQELQTFLRAAAGHRLFPALWLAAMTGVRRSELLGLRWTDLDIERSRLSVNRGLVTLLIAAGVPIKVVSERLGHASPAFTIETYQHVLPGMQAAAARTIETLVTAVLPATPQTHKAG